MSFQDDIQGQNTQLYPIVTIEPPNDVDKFSNIVDCIKLSTNDVSLYHIHKGYDDYDGTYEQDIVFGVPYHFKPLLLNIPSMKESIDIESRKFKISNVGLDISNIEYEGKRFTDILSDTSLINWKCSIQFVSPTADRFYTIASSVTSIGEGANYSWYDVYTDTGDSLTSWAYNEDIRSHATQMVYQGVIRRISHDNTKVKIELEDLTEQKAHKDLPSPESYIITENLPKKYINKPKPIVYGDVDRSPLALDIDEDASLIIIADEDNSVSYNEDEPLYINDQDTFLNAPIEAISPYSGNIMFRTEEISGETEIVYTETTQYFVNGNIIELNGSLNDGDDDANNMSGNAIGDNRIVVRQRESPLLVKALRTYPDSNRAYYSVKHDYNSVTESDGNFIVGDEVTHSQLPLIIRGILFREVGVDTDFYWDGESPSEIVDEALWANAPAPNFHEIEKGWAGAIIKLPIVEGIGEESQGYIFANIKSGVWNLSIGENYDDPNFRVRLGGNKVGDHNGQSEFEDGSGYIIFPDESAVGQFNLDGNYDPHSGGFNGLPNTGNTYNSITGNDKPIPIDKSSELLYYMKISQSAAVCASQTEFLDLYVEHWDLVKGLLTKDFYGNVRGRINTYTDHPYLSHTLTIDELIGLMLDWEAGFYEDSAAEIQNEFNSLYEDLVIEQNNPNFFPEEVIDTIISDTLNLLGDSLFIQNPIDIIYDIVRSELGHDAIDEDDYLEAKAAHDGWKFGFTVNKKINSKKLIEDIAKSTKCFPKFKNDGTFGFNTIKDNYTFSEYEADTTRLIRESEVISYSFKKTKPEQIYQKVTVSYNKDYAQDSYLNRTNQYIVIHSSVNLAGQIGVDNFTSTNVIGGDPSYYGIDLAVNGLSDASLEFESDYIRHDSDPVAEQTADKLASFLSGQYKNDHLMLNLKLPLKYINLEIGDLVKFEDLFQGVKAYGIDYTKPQSPNFQVYYPLFMVTSIKKSLDSVSIECMQLHHLGGYYDAEWNEFGIEWSGTEDVNVPQNTLYSDQASGISPPVVSCYLGGIALTVTPSTIDPNDVDYLTTSWGSTTFYSPYGNYDQLYIATDELGNQYTTIQNITISPSANVGDGEGVGDDIVINTWVIPANSFSLEIYHGYPALGFNYSWDGLTGTYIFDWTVDEGLVDLFSPSDTIRTIRIEQSGYWGVYRIPDVNLDGTLGGMNPIINNDGGIDTFLNLQFLGQSYDGSDPISTFTFNLGVDLTISEIPFAETMMMGDVNLDGILNILDVVSVVNTIVGVTVQPEGWYNADANSDGVVNVIDIIGMTNCILGTGSCEFG